MWTYTFWDKGTKQRQRQGCNCLMGNPPNHQESAWFNGTQKSLPYVNPRQVSFSRLDNNTGLDNKVAHNYVDYNNFVNKLQQLIAKQNAKVIISLDTHNLITGYSK